MHAFVLAALISTSPIKGHVQFLASDLLEGRGTGARGHEIAAEYVATQFESIGLEPGADGSWRQEITFLKTTPTAATITLARDGAAPVTLKLGQDFVSTGDPLSDEKRLEAELVFAGFGVTAPDQKHDDYDGLDTRSKIVVIWSGAPKTFPNAVRAHYSSTLNKIETAARHGAAGLIVVNTPLDAQRSPFARAVRQMKLGAMNWLDHRGVPHGVVPRVSFVTTLSQPAAHTVLGVDDIDKARRGPLPWRATIDLDTTRERVKSANVVGLLRGSDPQLAKEHLVYTSHLDHLGISEPVDGDSINNGAFDNASGIAALIEVARAFATQSPTPRRSIVFIATTAEEKGLRGADYFANNPTVPFESIVGNINVDMILMHRPLRSVTVGGAETNDLGDLARDVAREMQLDLRPDPAPEEVTFVRSDQYPFVKRGIPAIVPNAGHADADPEVAKVALAWRRTRYHMPQDDLSQPIDYSVGAMLAEFAYRIGLAAANRDARPQWKPGDFFGQTFGRR
jgi:Peptidase family M28/PA domain